MKAGSRYPILVPPVATPGQFARYLVPTIRGEREECYAITGEGAGSGVDAIEATARPSGDSWVLNGVKWHVTSFSAADYCFSGKENSSFKTAAWSHRRRLSSNGRKAAASWLPSSGAQS